jgi:hypothetical protein
MEKVAPVGAPVFLVGEANEIFVAHSASCR